MTDWLSAFSISPGVRAKLLTTVVVILVLWALRRFTMAMVFRRVTDAAARYTWRKSTTYIAVGLGALIVGRTWFAGLGEIATFLGLLSAGLAIALKDLVANLAGWVFILWRRPFEVGDRIQIGQHAGDVIDLRIFQFSVLEIGNWVKADQSTGRIIHVPNGLVFNNPLVNYTRGFRHIWEEVPVLVTFESDWRAAKDILLKATLRHAEHITPEADREIKAASRRFMIHFTNLKPTVYTSVEDSGVLLTARFLCDPRQRRGVKQAIWEDVLDGFSQNENLDFAYPTTRYYDNRSEGKPGTGGPG